MNNIAKIPEKTWNRPENGAMGAKTGHYGQLFLARA
jgi:hypothetical protein